MTVMPTVWCEIAFTKDAGGFNLWRDVTGYVEWDQGVTIARRRSHELDEVQPGTLSLTLDNSDGRFTAGRTSSPYYPNVTLNRPIRIRARWPNSVNLLLEKQGRASDVTLFSASQGSLANEASIVPAGQTTSIRWSPGTLASTGQNMRAGSTDIATATDRAMPVVEGATYAFSAMVRRDASVTVSVSARIRWYNAGGVFLTQTAGTAVGLTTSFQAVTCVATAPAGAVWARVAIANTTTTASAVIIYAGAWQFERAASVTAWAAPGVEYHRFTGFVDRWPHQWSNGVLGLASITATDRQKLLGRDKIRAALSQEILGSNPLVYYPLSEPQGSTQGGNLASTPQPDMLAQQSGIGGTYAFGEAGGPDESTGVLLTPVDINNGQLLVSSLTTPLGGVAGISVAVWVNFGPTPQTGQNRLIFVDNGTDTTHFRINYAPSTNSLSVGVRLPGGSTAGSTTSFNLDNNELHLVVATAQLVAGTVQIRCYIDGVMGINTSPAMTGTTWPALTRIRVGGLPGSALDPPEMMSGLVSNVCAWNSVLTQAQAQALSDARDGFAGELSGARAARIAGWAGITDTAFDAGSSLMDRHPAGEQALLAAFKQIAFSEAGLFFISGDGYAVLHGRDRRQFPPAVSITLSADQLGVDLQFTMDDQLLANDVSVSRSGRTVTRVVDQASIDAHEGTYAISIDTLLYSDVEALDRASYTLYTYGNPQPRAGQISVDAHSLGTVWGMMLGSDIGDRMEITSLPSEAPSSTLELWCEGVADVITDSTWRFVLDTSPFRDAPVFILDDPEFGTLDNNYLGW
ncbi:hypothetical protein [Nonomuraea gerenzanensis]|uniref:RTX toxin, putative n=1 Tax=Nonomuraea gerenzanensis TaxID=93944 RepID=A0A1M4BKY8_9ACTN|nr:hypothetical protein [Nonomuraea gerenzanensis]UBU10039.1 hypothetical protein LCN96_37560 [Nonomuraea gerenzanensis]SAP16337.1 RTX toxin, putative [Nonomuraea gerenzanensis]